MATLYGDQYQDAFVDKPSTKIRHGDVSGDKKLLYFEYTITAAPSNSDVIKVGKLPLGARVINAGLQFPDLGTAGTLELGFDAGADDLETADPDAFLVSVDVNSARDAVSMQQQMEAGGNNAGYMKVLADTVDVEIFVTAAWTVTSGTIKGFVEYVMV
jgi:hypothetical protein